MTAQTPSLLARPAPDDFIRFREGFGTRFLLVVDTEEEFDWSAPFDRNNRQVSAIAGMRRGHDYFASAGVRPLYVTDYPVVDDAGAREMMAQWVADGTADIGAHLHPWVNPPHEEAVNAANSFAGSLPEPLERAKLTHLRDRLAEAFGKPPLAYRAGRYGIGPHSGQILAELGFRVDTSVRSRFNYTHQHGPDFSGLPLRPYRTGPGKQLLELPLSTAYTGILHRAGDRLFPRIAQHGLACGLLSRTGLLERIPLTPEGVPVAAAIRAVDRLLADGQQLLMFSFHSPTLEAGHTPYVRNQADLAAFYHWWDVMLAHLAARGVKPAHLDEIVAAVAT